MEGLRTDVVPCTFLGYQERMGAKFPLICKPAIVYQATNRLNGKRHIGATTKSLLERRQSHIYDARHGPNRGAFYSAIRKYGIDVFDWATLSTHASAKSAAKEEARLIATMRPEYNSTPGGLGFHRRTWSAEARRALSAKKKGVPTGRHLPMPEHVKEALRAANIGRSSHWKGKKLPAHVCAMISERMAMRADKARVLAMGPKSLQRRTVCLNDGKEYESASAAALAYGLNKSQLTEVCNRKPNRKSVNGLVFRYHGEPHGGYAEVQAILEEVRRSNAQRAAIARQSVLAAVARPVQCIDDGLVFPTIKAAADYYGARADAISNVCAGKRGYRTASGRRFSYKSRS